MAAPRSVDIAELAALAREAGAVALDAEFVGERRYWPLLCLVQFAVQTDDGVATALVDPLEEGTDPTPIVEALADPGVETVVHAGSQDVILVRRAWGVQIARVFDTQVAAAFLGGSMQLSYKEALRRFLDLKLEQSEGFTHWDRRPLTDKQLEYAREDVEHLPALATEMRSQLEQAGRLEWAREESSNLLALPDRRDPEDTFLRMARSGSGRPKAAELSALKQLVLWREQTAEREDRPTRSVLADQAVQQLARRRPTTIDQFGDIRGVHGGVSRRYGKQILRVLREAESMPPPEVDRPKKPPAEVEPLASLATAFVRARSIEQGLASQMIASSSELTSVVIATVAGVEDPDSGVTRGWRRELVGAELLELLRGRRSITVGDDHRLAITPRD